MKISIEIPPRVYGQLADLADAHGVRIGDLIAETVHELLGPRPRRGRTTIITPEIEAEIRALAALNRSQAEISASLNVALSTVSRAAKRMGLKTLRERKTA